MKIDWCKILGHKWSPTEFKGYFEDGKYVILNGKNQCKRCNPNPTQLTKEEIVKLKKALKEMFNDEVVNFSENHYKK